MDALSVLVGREGQDAREARGRVSVAREGSQSRSATVIVERLRDLAEDRRF
jgi:hypothetical protein